MKYCFVSDQGDDIIITALSTGQKAQFARMLVLNDRGYFRKKQTPTPNEHTLIKRENNERKSCTKLEMGMQYACTLCRRC